MNKFWPVLSLLVVGFIATLGTFWAFQRGGKDFDVFYTAWSLVLAGRAQEIYTLSPDRFLYAPGFAFLFAPIALLPKTLALALWCFAKAALLGLVLRSFAKRVYMREQPLVGAGFCAVGALIWSRAILIDFEYGQVNLFILGVCVWALSSHYNRERSGFLPWLLLAIAGVAKVFPLPLLWIPFLMGWSQAREKLKQERWGVIVGLMLVGALPFFLQGFEGGLHLLASWREALLAKGLPTESHNQSFAALLLHYFSGNPTAVISENGSLIQFGASIFTADTLKLIELAWTFVTGGLLLGWIVSGPSKEPLKWIAITIGLLILPLHLIWKPYFVMGIPVAILLVRQAQVSRHLIAMLVATFFVINFSGFDFTGHAWGPKLEAAALLLVVHIALIGALVYMKPKTAESI